MIQIYDSATHKKESLETVDHGKVKMYVCGPTVYNYIHIGNARTFISFDVIRRYLEWRKFDVIFVQNITDVDDKIINRAASEGRSAQEVAQEFSDAFIADMRAINVKDPTVRPRATQEIPEMINLVQKLIDTGHAYVADNGDVYFSVRSYDGYGQLSGRNVDEAESGHRSLRAEDLNLEELKRDEQDFALWKAAKPGEPSWESPWGQGRPGWHLECSTMAQKYLGLPFDIHGGGADLIFPHHENERAQSQAATGSVFANHWMHGGMLQINQEKMSKSLGNFMLLRDILKTTDPNVLRFLMIQTHYRSPLEFNDERLDEAATALGRIVNAAYNLQWAVDHADPQTQEDALDSFGTAKFVRETKIEFLTAMDDDFNTPKALGVIFDFVSGINSLTDGKVLSPKDVELLAEVRKVLDEFMDVFGVDLQRALDQLAQGGSGEEDYPEGLFSLAAEIAGYDGADGAAALQALLAVRTEARAAREWSKADAVRDGLGGLGYVIEDTPQGPRILRS